MSPEVLFMVCMMTTHIDCELAQKVFEERSGQEIGFGRILSVTHLEHDTIDMLHWKVSTFISFV